MKLIRLRGKSDKVVKVDNSDYASLSEFKWYEKTEKHQSYAVRYLSGTNSKMRMHRQLMGLNVNDNRLIDHVNGDGLDNRRINLRFSNKILNGANQGPRNGRSFKYVYLNKRTNGWYVLINRGCGRKSIYGGYFGKDIVAAKRRAKSLVISVYGKFGRIN